jgi:hypothetical protein
VILEDCKVHTSYADEFQTGNQDGVLFIIFLNVYNVIIYFFLCCRGSRDVAILSYKYQKSKPKP